MTPEDHEALVAAILAAPTVPGVENLKVASSDDAGLVVSFEVRGRVFDWCDDEPRDKDEMLSLFRMVTSRAVRIEYCGA